MLRIAFVVWVLFFIYGKCGKVDFVGVERGIGWVSDRLLGGWFVE